MAAVTEEDLARLAESGVYDPLAADAGDQRRLIEQLVAEGLTVDDLARSNRVGNLVIRAFEHLIQPGERTTVAAAAAAAGLTVERVLLVRRAWGFPDPPPDHACFTPSEIAALEFFRDMAGFVGPDLALHFARVMGTATSRLAEAEIALVRSQLEAPMQGRHESGASILGAYASVMQSLFPAALRTFDALHRAHLVWLGRRYTDGALPPSDKNVLDLVVGFADLTHSTALVQRMDLAGLDAAITAFETVTSDLLAEAGAPVVKRLGDGVMFVTSLPDKACAVALDLVDAFRHHAVAPPVRVGLAAGRVAALRGDFFGLPVHLAARIVATAAPSTVLVSGEVRDRIEAAGARVLVGPAGPHRLAGFAEPVDLYRLERIV